MPVSTVTADGSKIESNAITNMARQAGSLVDMLQITVEAA